jgi:hypothetical protein
MQAATHHLSFHSNSGLKDGRAGAESNEGGD